MKNESSTSDQCERLELTYSAGRQTLHKHTCTAHKLFVSKATVARTLKFGTETKHNTATEEETIRTKWVENMNGTPNHASSNSSTYFRSAYEQKTYHTTTCGFYVVFPTTKSTRHACVHLLIANGICGKKRLRKINSIVESSAID